jgi:hypothetical protein
MTKRCLKVLSIGSANRGTDVDEYARIAQPLLQYAAEYWFVHYQHTKRKRLSDDELKALDERVCVHLHPDSASFKL